MVLVSMAIRTFTTLMSAAAASAWPTLGFTEPTNNGELRFLQKNWSRAFSSDSSMF